MTETKFAPARKPRGADVRERLGGAVEVIDDGAT